METTNFLGYKGMKKGYFEQIGPYQKNWRRLFEDLNTPKHINTKTIRAVSTGRDFVLTWSPHEKDEKGAFVFKNYVLGRGPRPKTLLFLALCFLRKEMGGAIRIDYHWGREFEQGLTFSANLENERPTNAPFGPIRCEEDPVFREGWRARLFNKFSGFSSIYGDDSDNSMLCYVSSVPAPGGGKVWALHFPLEKCDFATLCWGDPRIIMISEADRDQPRPGRRVWADFARRLKSEGYSTKRAARYDGGEAYSKGGYGLDIKIKDPHMITIINSERAALKALRQEVDEEKQQEPPKPPAPFVGGFPTSGLAPTYEDWEKREAPRLIWGTEPDPEPAPEPPKAPEPDPEPTPEPEPPEAPKAEEAPKADLTEAQKTENFFAKVEHDRKILNTCRQLEEQAEADILRQIEPHKDYLMALLDTEAPFTLERRKKRDGTWEISIDGRGLPLGGRHLVDAGHAPARAQRILLDSFFAPQGCMISEDCLCPECFMLSPSQTEGGIHWATWRVLWEGTRDHYPYLSDADRELPTDDRPISVFLAEFKLKGREHYSYHLVNKAGGDGMGYFGHVSFRGKQHPPEVAILNLKAQAKERGWTLRRGRAALDATEQCKGGDFVFTHYELRPTKRFLERYQEMRERLRALSLEEGRETREEARQHLPDFEPPHACDRTPEEQMAEVTQTHLAPHLDALNQAIDQHIEATIAAPKAPKAPTPEPDPQPDRIQEQAPVVEAPKPDPEPKPDPTPEPPPPLQNEGRIAVMRPRPAPYQLSLF